MKLRKAQRSDIDEITRVIRRAYSTVARDYGLDAENCPKHPSNCAVDWVEGDFDRGVHYFVIESGRELVGCMALEKASDDTCYLERLAVIPEERNNGAGTMLVSAFIQKASEMGFEKIGIGIIAKQEELKSWYQKIGFIETGKRTFEHLPFEVAFMEYSIADK